LDRVGFPCKFFFKLEGVDSFEGGVVVKVISPVSFLDREQEMIVIMKGFSGSDSDMVFFEGHRAIIRIPRYPEFHYGECMIFSGKLSSSRDVTPNLRSLMRAKEVSYYGKIFSVTGFECPKRPSYPEKIAGNLYQIQRAARNNIEQSLPEPGASLAAGILLGSSGVMPKDFKNSLSKTGLTHIIALSGYNISILLFAVVGLLVGVFGKKWSLSLGLIFVTLFVVMTGASASLVRAALLALFVVIAKIFGREPYLPSVLTSAALVMSIDNPFVIRYDLGFQLSFLAFIGLIYLGNYYERIFARVKFIPKLLQKMVAETLGAQSAVIPLIIAKFGTVSLIAPLANILIVPVVPLIMAVAFVSAMLGFISPVFSNSVGLILWLLGQYVIRLVTFLASLPGSNFLIEIGK